MIVLHTPQITQESRYKDPVNQHRGVGDALFGKAKKNQPPLRVYWHQPQRSVGVGPQRHRHCLPVFVTNGKYTLVGAHKTWYICREHQQKVWQLIIFIIAVKMPWFKR